MDTIVSKVRFHIKDIYINDQELEMLVTQVLEDIAGTTKIFKKLYGFTLHESIEVYNFREIARMNEQVEVELQDVVIGTPDRSEMIKFLLSGSFPTPNVQKTQFVESDAMSYMLDLLDIFDANGMSVTDKFQYHGTTQYYCLDKYWRKDNDTKTFCFTASVSPHIDEINPEDLLIIMDAVIEGVKYYAANTLQTVEDGQVANIYYQRFFSKQQNLIDRYPTQIFSIMSPKGISQWP